MKLDKEALNKNRFWILLGTFVFAWFIVFGMLMSGCEPEKIDGASKTIKGKIDTNYDPVPGKKMFWEIKEARDEVGKVKLEVWSEAWKPQKFMIHWPPDSPETRARLPEKMENAPFGSPLCGLPFKLTDASFEAFAAPGTASCQTSYWAARRTRG